MNKYPEAYRINSWGIGQTKPASASASEAELEKEVSRVLGDMRVLWLEIQDNASPSSDRAYIERNCIALLSRWNLVTGVVPESWLGHFSNDMKIAISGLWNLNYLFEEYDRGFLNVLRQYVDIALGRKASSNVSIAPPSWYPLKSKNDDRQLQLL